MKCDTHSFPLVCNSPSAVKHRSPVTYTITGTYNLGVLGLGIKQNYHHLTVSGFILQAHDHHLSLTINGPSVTVIEHMRVAYPRKTHINVLRQGQNGRHFPDDIYKCIFLNENAWISLRISLMFVPKCPINYIPALVQIMDWHRLGNKPLSEPMTVRLLTHICVGLNVLNSHIVKPCLPILFLVSWSFFVILHKVWQQFSIHVRLAW